MKLRRRQFLQIAGAAAVVPVMPQCASAQARSQPNRADFVFPRDAWESASPEEMGWSPQRLEQARQFFQTLPAASMVVVDQGRVILAWGDPDKRIKMSSVRKSLLSALYGRYVRDGVIGLDTTLDQLGIDDDPPLTLGKSRLLCGT